MKELFKNIFNKQFSEELHQLGFFKMKNCEAFVRLINDEILQTIYVIDIGSVSPNKYVFTIGTSVRSVYIEKISKREIMSNKFSIYDLLSDEEKTLVPWQAYCYVCNENDIDQVVKKALFDVVKLIIPIYDRIKNLIDYIEFSLATDQADLSFGYHAKESLIWVKAAKEIDCDRFAKALVGYTVAMPENVRCIPQIAIDIKREYLLEKYIGPLECILLDPVKFNEANLLLLEIKKATMKFFEKNGIKFY